MKNIYIGMTGILSSVILYGFYHLSVIIFSYGWNSWPGNDYRIIMNKTGGFLYFPLLISIILFLLGVYFIYKGIREEK